MKRLRVKDWRWYVAYLSVILTILQLCILNIGTEEKVAISANTATDSIGGTLSYKMYDHSTTSGDAIPRGYLEYNIGDDKQWGYTMGIPRKTTLYVYAFAGETICLGSDIVASLLDEDDNRLSEASGVDIVLIGPDGTKYTFDNSAESGIGYIGSYEQEKAGANYTGSGNTKGYTPHEFTVKETGIYEVHFHSHAGSSVINSGDRAEEPHSGNINQGDPTPYNLNSNNFGNNGGTIGAYDITVVGDNGAVKSGRTYGRYLAINMGKNSGNGKVFFGEFYMVTNDGYIYRNNFELDPFGFVFFCNSRGIVDKQTGYSAYHSIRGISQATGGVINMGSSSKFYDWATPNSADTELDKTYMVFFEEPDEAMEGILYSRAYAPEVILDIDFVGSKEGNITYEGNGGYFRFKVKNASSVTISLDLHKYNAENNTNFENITINANVVKGLNYVYWDGRDKNGEILPEGWYNDSNIEISVTSHAGEFHFPFLDVENCASMKFERVNQIYDVDENGLTKDVTAEYDAYKNTFYYNNTILENHANYPGYKAEYDTDTNAKNDNIIGDGKDASLNGATDLKFITNNYGDYAIIDLWAYAGRTNTSKVNAELIIEKLKGYEVANLNGIVFFDKDYNQDNKGKYTIANGDFALSDVEVDLDYYYLGSRWKITREDKDNASSEIVKLEPAYRSHKDEETGQEIIDYYYHHFVVVRGDDGKYYLYQYKNVENTGDPEPVYNADEEHISVDILQYNTVGTDGQSIAEYLVWIPIHLETTTDAVGKYYFSGILLNNDYYSYATNLGDTPEDFKSIKITVHNPDDTIYEMVTSQAVTGDFNGAGTETQYISKETLNQKVLADKLLDSEKTIFTYMVADVGYWYETAKPLQVRKQWPSFNDTENVNEIAVELEGYEADNDPATTNKFKGYYHRSIILDNYNGWQRVITDLPAETTTGKKLSWRIIGEVFNKPVYNADGSLTSNEYHFSHILQKYGITKGGVSYLVSRGDNDSNGYPTVLIEETTDQGVEPEYRDTYYLKEADGSEVILDKSDWPFKSYVSDIVTGVTYDTALVENWSADTTSVAINKVAADDGNTYLSGASFQLQKYVDGSYIDQTTTSGTYIVTTNKKGKAVFHGITEGKYRLIELTAPTNYTVLKEPVYFTVSKDGSATTGITGGDYEDGYLLEIEDELLISPMAYIRKFDQYTNIVAGAEFELYRVKTDDNGYFFRDGNPITLQMTKRDKDGNTVTGDNGEPIKEDRRIVINDEGYFEFVTENKDGEVRPLYLTELQELLGGSEYFILHESGIPDGYRSVGDIVLKFIGDGHSKYVVCENTFESGADTSPRVQVFAPETIYLANMEEDLTKFNSVAGEDGGIPYITYGADGQAVGNGSLYAVILKRNLAESNVSNLFDLTFEGWDPVYGNNIDGYTEINGTDTTLTKAINVIQKGGAYRFGLQEGDLLKDVKEMTALIENMPGSIDRYYTFMLENGLTSSDLDRTYNAYIDPQYTVAYYYSTAENPEGMTESNTARVTSHGLVENAKSFATYWSTEIKIPDIVETLYVQKTNTGNTTLIDGAVFALYDAYITDDGAGYYEAISESGDKKYVTLSESEAGVAYVYDGTVDINGVLTLANEQFIRARYSLDDIPENSLLELAAGGNGLVDDIENPGVIHVEFDTGLSQYEYEIRPAKSARHKESGNTYEDDLVSYTHNECLLVTEKGTAHFQYIKQGNYFLKEIQAPSGYMINLTNVEVIVDNNGVYANAGTSTDDIMVGNGAGYLVSTLNSYASIGSVDSTLSYIVAALRLKTDVAGFTTSGEIMQAGYVQMDNDHPNNYIFTGDVAIGETLGSTSSDSKASVLYLKYAGNANSKTKPGGVKQNLIFDYSTNEEGYAHSENVIPSLLFWTKVGWGDLAIFQHTSYLEAKHTGGFNNIEKTAYTNLALNAAGQSIVNDISNLYSSSTFVRFADRGADLTIQKSDLDGNGLYGGNFVLYKKLKDEPDLYYTYDETTGHTDWVSLEETDTNVPYYLKSGKSVLLTTDKDGYIQLHDLPDGTYYLREVSAPAGYKLLNDDEVIKIIVNGGIFTVPTQYTREIDGKTLVLNTLDVNNNILTVLNEPKPEITLPTEEEDENDMEDANQQEEPEEDTPADDTHTDDVTGTSGGVGQGDGNDTYREIPTIIKELYMSTGVAGISIGVLLAGCVFGLVYCLIGKNRGS